MNLTTADVLGDEGLIAKRLPRFESRGEQMQMADAVAEAIAQQHHLIVEAGTGVGKSFAYLVPAILASISETHQEPSRPKRIVISTHTISLQEQLIAKDIPFLNAVMPMEFSAVLVKGRSNYISLRRLKAALERSSTALFEPEAVGELRNIREWAETSRDGSLADLAFQPQREIWDEVQSEHGNCLGRKCPTYDECFYYRARRRVWNANILVVNHALFFSDLALRREGASILPDYDVVVFDEAHTIEAVAGEHLGISLSTGQLRYLFNKLFNERLGKGLLVHHNLVSAQKQVLRLRMLTEDLFDSIQHWQDQHVRDNGRVGEPPAIANILSPELRSLARELARFAESLEEETQAIELTASSEKLQTLALSLEMWLKQELEDGVYWIEKSSGRQRNTKLVSAPIEVGPVLRDELFNRGPTCILTSATLAAGANDFSFFRSRLGCTTGQELQLGSPFDYEKQVRLVLAEGMPDPSEQPAEYEREVCQRIPRYIQETDGRAFVLFTSYRMMKQCAERLTSWFARQNLLLLCQGSGLPRSAMLQKFQRDGNAVLFGTESFWQGVDVPGDALRNVIITKLPFSVPDHPLLEARIERIRQRGGNPFMEYQVPEATIKLRQGFGRLIRSRSDSGQVVILDPRIQTKRYGRIFLNSLPRCRVEMDD